MCPGMSPTNNLPELLRVGQALDWEAGETGFVSSPPEGLGKTLGSSEPNSTLVNGGDIYSI